MRHGRGLLAIILSLLGSLGAGPAPGQHLFATDANHSSPALRRFTYLGAAVVTQPLAAATLPEGIAFDEAAKQLYWVEASYSGARIRRTDPSLGPGTTILSGLGSLRGIAVEPAANRLFWTSSDQTEARISRASLDGSNPVVLLSLPGFNPRQIAVDSGNAWVYWTELDYDGIARCRPDGSEAQWVTILPPGSRPYGIAVSELFQELFWTQYGTGTVEKMALPPGPEPAPAAARPATPSLEQRSAALVATLAGRAGGVATRASAARAATAVLGGLVNPTHLTLDEDTAEMWVSQAGVGVQSVLLANMDGSGLLTLPVPQAAFGGIVAVGTALLDVPEPPGGRPAGVPLALAARNPARGSAELTFGLPASGFVRLRVYDAAGREVATVAEGEHAAGPHRVTWTGQANSGRAAPGMYVARLEAAGKQLTRRFAYVK
jgi:hypothetical protein